MEQGASGVQSSFGVPGSEETSFNKFLRSSLTYRALVVDRRRLIVVDVLVAIATISVLGQKSSSSADGCVPLTLDRLVAVQALRGSSTAASTKELGEAGTLAELDRFWAPFELWVLVEVGSIFFPSLLNSTV